MMKELEDKAEPEPYIMISNSQACPISHVQDSPPQLLPNCKEGNGLCDGQKHQVMKALKSMTGPRDHKSKGRRKKSAPLRASPCNTMLAPPLKRSNKYFDGLQEDGDHKTALVSSIQLDGNVLIPDIPIISTSTTSNCEYVPRLKTQNCEHRNKKDLTCTYRKKYSNNKEIEEIFAKCDSKQTKKFCKGLNENDIDCRKMLVNVQNSETQQDQDRIFHGSLGHKKLSVEYNKINTSVLFCNPENQSGRKSSNDTLNVPPISSVCYAKRKFRKEKRKERPATALLTSNSQILNGIDCAQDIEVSPSYPMNSGLEELQVCRGSDSPTFSRKVFKQSMPRYSRNPAFPSSSCSEPFYLLKDRQRSSSVKRKNAPAYYLHVPSSCTDNEKQLRHLSRPEVKTRKQEDPSCSNESRSLTFLEAQKLLNLVNSGKRGQHVLRMVLPPRSTSVSKSRKSQAHETADSGLGAVNQRDDQSPLYLMQTEGKKRKTGSRDNIYRKPVSVSTGKSDTDISNSVLRNRKNIRLSTRPASVSGVTHYVTASQLDIQTQFKEQSLYHRGKNRKNISPAKIFGKSGNLQKYLLSQNEQGDEDKVTSNKPWPGTRLSIQGNECLSEDGKAEDPACGGFQVEYWNAPIVFKLWRGKGLLSTLGHYCQDCVTNVSPVVHDSRRSSLWPRTSEPSPGPALSFPEYFKRVKSAAQSAFPPSALPPDLIEVRETFTHDVRKWSRTARGVSPPIDKGNPKKMAALTAAGHIPVSSRSSKSNRRCVSSFGYRRFWGSCLLFYFVLVVVIQVGAIVFLGHGKMLPLFNMVESRLHQNVDELRQNMITANSSTEHEDCLP